MSAGWVDSAALLAFNVAVVLPSYILLLAVIPVTVTVAAVISAVAVACGEPNW